MNKEFTKSDLKPGMVVEDRSRVKYLTCKFAGNTLVFLNNDSWDPVSIFNEDLTYTVPELDIMKVYNPISACSLLGLFDSNNHMLSLIWERE